LILQLARKERSFCIGEKSMKHQRSFALSVESTGNGSLLPLEAARATRATNYRRLPGLVGLS